MKLHMPGDKFSAVWVSHSSISDFIKCPRCYYLKNVYRDPATKHKITIMTPPLALGQSVHEVIEALSVIRTEDRFRESLIEKFQTVWKKVSGKYGGFTSPEQEQQYKLRGEAMLRRVMENPGPLKNKAVKINMDLPYYWLSPDEEIILCGKIDWLEYHQVSDSVSIIDFKTGKHEEDGESLQLPIYHLLVANTQRRKVEKVCYWYLDKDNEVCQQELPDLQTAHDRVLEVAKKIKLARKLNLFKCTQQTGCYACKPFEAVLRGEGELVGTNEYNTDVYILKPSEAQEDSYIL